MKCHIDTLKTKRFIPNGFLEQRYDELDLVFYTSGDEHEQSSAICYEGRRLKPNFHYRYLSLEKRTDALQKYMNATKKDFEAKQARQKERREFKTTLKVGDFVYTSWGYDQTNIEFFQVIKVKSAKTIVLREVNQTRTDKNGYSDMSCFVEPNENDFKSDCFEKRVGFNDYVRFESFRSASKWDGQPKYCSWYA